MSILIKGLIMPHCCDVCTFSDWSNLHQTAVCKVNYYKPCFADHSREYTDKRADFCPLVEIPELHGDLIDREAPEIVRCGEYKHNGTHNCLLNLWATIFNSKPKDDFFCGMAERRTDG